MAMVAVVDRQECLSVVWLPAAAAPRLGRADGGCRCRCRWRRHRGTHEAWAALLQRLPALLVECS